MASKLEFVEYVADQLGEAGEITYRKMFGEYGIYCNGKFFATICEDQLFFKITEGGRKLWPDLEEGIPYHGAKPHFLIEELGTSRRTGAGNLPGASHAEAEEKEGGGRWNEKRKVRSWIIKRNFPTYICPKRSRC